MSTDRGCKAQRLQIQETLLNNCSFELWKERYLNGRYDSETEDEAKRQALADRAPLQSERYTNPYAQSEWCVSLKVCDDFMPSTLFGVTEDIRCKDKSKSLRHAQEKRNPPHCRILCPSCEIPICRECKKGLC